MYDGYKALSANIFNQAISDYKKLLIIQKNNKLNKEQKELVQRGIKENERFFRSNWAQYLAEYLDITFDPDNFIEKLRSEVK